MEEMSWCWFREAEGMRVVWKERKKLKQKKKKKQSDWEKNSSTQSFCFFRQRMRRPRAPSTRMHPFDAAHLLRHV